MALENPRSRLQLPLLWLLMFTLTSSVVLLLRQVAPDYWQATTFIVAATSAWGIFTTRYLAVLERWRRNALRYRAAELVILALLSRLFLWLIFGFPQGHPWNEYLRNPFIILDDQWWVHFFIIVIVWSWSNRVTMLFNQLDFAEFELNLHDHDGQNLSSFHQRNRPKLLGEYFTFWSSGGVLLIFITALATYQLSDFREANWFSTVSRLPIPPQLLVNLLLYLFVGLWLLSYVRYQVLFSHWLYRGVQPQPQLARLWRRSSLLLLGIVACFCAFLPIGSTVPLFWMGQVVYYILSIIAATLFYIFGWLLALLGRLLTLFRGEDQSSPEPLIPEVEAPSPLPIDSGQGEPLVPAELTGGLLWLIIVVVIIAALLFLIRGQNYGLFGNVIQQVWMNLRGWWGRLRQEVGERVTDMRHAVQEQLGRTRPPTQKNARPRVNALTPREQIRYYYLATIKRAAERGVQRDESETPVEFLSALQKEFPESADDSEALTEAFLQARYSTDAVEEESVSPVKQKWKRIRRSLRRT